MGYYSGQRRELLAHLPDSLGTTLELGCAEGHHGKLLIDRNIASSVIGVDLHVPGDTAASNLTEFHRADVADWLRTYQGARFNTVLAHDVLEHLVDPWTAVRQICRLLKPGGLLVSSIPNVRFVKVLADLAFRGRFEYGPSGILDRTHLRFFTRKSIARLAMDGGFERATIRRLRYTNQRTFTRMIAAPLGDFGCRQFVLIAQVN